MIHEKLKSKHAKFEFKSKHAKFEFKSKHAKLKSKHLNMLNQNINKFFDWLVLVYYGNKIEFCKVTS